MKLIQRLLLATIFLLAYGVVGVAQSSKLPPPVALPSPIALPFPVAEISPHQNPKDDGCPPAEMMSDTYSTFEATVLDVIDGNTLIVRSKDKKRKVIQMVGIAVADIKTIPGIASKEHLASLVLGKKIEVWLISTNARVATSREAIGIIVVSNPERLDINLEQIKKGMAQYIDFGSYTQSSRDRCLYAKAETEAKAARLGIWAQ